MEIILTILSVVLPLILIIFISCILTIITLCIFGDGGGSIDETKDRLYDYIESLADKIYKRFKK